MLSIPRQRFYSLNTGILLALSTLTIMLIAFANAINFTSYPFAGFFFQPNLYVSFTERAGWKGMEQDIQPLDRLTAINGVKLDNGSQALKMIQNTQPGSLVKFTLASKNGIKNIELKLSKFTTKDFAVTFLMPFLIGLFFFITGFVVFLLNPLKKIAFIHFLSSLFVALFYSTVLDSNTTYWFYRLFALYPFFGATSVHLILCITSSNFLRKYPFTEIIPYLIAGIIVYLQQYYLYSEYSAFLIYVISPIFLVGCTIMNFSYLLLHYITTKDVDTRRRTRFYIIALFFGTIIPTLWAVTFAIGKPILSLDLGIALSVFYPIFTGYAITREDLFNLESIVRTTLEYIVFTGIVIGAYFIIAGITSIALQGLIENNPIINTSITIVILILLSPLRNRIQTFIDKTFYPERFDIRDKLSEVTVNLAYVRDRKTLGSVLGKKIANIISVKDAGLIYPSSDGKVSFYSSPKKFAQLDLSKHTIKRLFTNTGKIEYFSDIVNEFPPRARKKEMTELKKIDPFYLMPIGQENTRGILVIRDKHYLDSRFIHDDFHFLKSIYPQIEIALVNAELHEQKADKERLAAIGEVSSVIIHEIKNPLGIIKISSAALKKRINNDAKAMEVIGFIEEEVSRMNDTITNFLDFAKPKIPRKRTFSITELVAYLENLAINLKRENYILTTSIEGEQDSIMTDPGHVKQILLNLVLNAKESMPEGGNISVSITGKNSEMEIVVRDSGKGIEKNVGQKLFDPFFTTKEHGTGLGLSASRQLARSNGGDIIWKNNDEGTGASFIVTIGSETYDA
ncbi:MAG: hypothetical protein JXA66_02145 [Oligoflexia bacterium]|nr:hypothetical protein [Oligoflexia bacterium]